MLYRVLELKDVGTVCEPSLVYADRFNLGYYFVRSLALQEQGSEKCRKIMVT